MSRSYRKTINHPLSKINKKCALVAAGVPDRSAPSRTAPHMSAPRKSAFDTLASVRVVPSMWQAADRLTSVPGLLAKPIVDVAVGVRRDADPEAVRRRLVALGWVYRGDAGDAGGHVFILERGPGIRIAHLHVVEHDGVATSPSATGCSVIQRLDRPTNRPSGLSSTGAAPTTASGRTRRARQRSFGSYSTERPPSRRRPHDRPRGSSACCGRTGTAERCRRACLGGFRSAIEVRRPRGTPRARRSRSRTASGSRSGIATSAKRGCGRGRRRRRSRRGGHRGAPGVRA